MGVGILDQFCKVEKQRFAEIKHFLADWNGKAVRDMARTRECTVAVSPATCDSAGSESAASASLFLF